MPGNWKFEEKIDKASTTTTDITVRELRSSVKTVTTGTYIDNGIIPYELKFETLPASWIPSEVDWTLSMVDGTGKTLKTYEGSYTSLTNNTLKWVQEWNCQDGNGNVVKTGGGITPVLTVSVPQAPAAQAQTAKVAPKALAAVAASPTTTINPILSGGPSVSPKAEAVPSVKTLAVSASALPAGTPIPTLARNPDGSYGAPGDIWQVCIGSDADVTFTPPQSFTFGGTLYPYPNVGITHLGQMVIRVNDPPSDILSLTNANGTTVFADSQPYTTPTQDPAVDFVLPPGQTLNNIIFSFVDSTGNYACSGLNGVYIYLIDATQGKAVLVAGIGLSGETDNYCTGAFGDNFNPSYNPALNQTPDSSSNTSGNSQPTSGCGCGTSSSQTSSMSSAIPITIENGSGRYYHSFTDLTIPTKGLPLVVSRSYDSEQQGQAPRFGWDWNFHDRLTIDSNSGTVFHIGPTGIVNAFTSNGGVFTATDTEVTDQLTQTDARHYQILTKNQMKTVYEVPEKISVSQTAPFNAVLKKQIDPNGNENTFTWGPYGHRLLRIEGPDPSQFLTLKWSDDRGPDKVTDYTGRTILYRY